MRNESFPYEPEETNICCVPDTMFYDLPSTLCSQHNLPHPSHNTPEPSLPKPNCSTRDQQDPWTNIWHLAAVCCHFWPRVPEGREAQSSLCRFSPAPTCSQPAWGWGEDRAQWPALKSGQTGRNEQTFLLQKSQKLKNQRHTSVLISYF